MEPEQYGWKIVLTATVPDLDYPIEAPFQVAKSPDRNRNEAEAEAAAREMFRLLYRDMMPAPTVQSVSVKVLWSPDFRRSNKSGQWQQRDRNERHEDPWHPIPGKPAIPLKRIESYAGCTYYIPKPA